MMSSRSSWVRRLPPTSACIIASSTAALTVTAKGCGTTSSTMSTPRAAQVGQALVGDRRADDRLAGEVLEVEADELVVRRDDHVGVPGGPAGQGVADEGPRGLDARPQRSGQPTHRPQRGRRRQLQERVAGHPGGQVEAQERVGERDVVGQLPQQPGGAVVVRAAQHDGAGVGEVAGHLGLHVTHRPLLQDVAEPVPVADRDVGGGLLDLLHGVELPVVQPGGACLADAGDRDRVGVRRPGADQRLRGGDVTGGADAHEPEGAVEEGDGLVVVALGTGEADVGDHQRRQRRQVASGRPPSQVIAFAPTSGWVAR